MMKKGLVRLLLLTLVFAVGAAAAACDDGSSTTDTGTDMDVTQDDMLFDPDADMDAPPPDADVPVDPGGDDGVAPDITPDIDPDLTCPASCQTGVPAGGQIGAACVSHDTCEFGSQCSFEETEFFDSRLYVGNPGGQCLIIGAGTEGCDPDVAATCPAGSVCLYAGESMGQEYYGCFDACEPVDTAGNQYAYNCGCREGYECSITSNACFDGCSNDGQCCERWWDLNGDFARGTDEVVAKAGCTNTCDNGGLFDDPPGNPGICAVSFSCVNEGDSSNSWGGPCEGDAWCPPDGRCLDAYHYSDPDTGPYWPGGYCIKDACNYAGRGCSEHGGACANLGSTDDPFYACVGTCHFGREVTAGDYECRSSPAGEEQACRPVEADFWHSAPGGGIDGFCWSGSFHEGGAAVGATCAEDDDCISPFGIGSCIQFTGITAPSFCSAQCSATSAAAHNICGGDGGDGTATGGCWSYMCWESCETPDAAPGSNGCSQADMACYNAELFGEYLAVYGGLTAPAGICIPKCIDNAWCADFFGPTMGTCNTESGVCGP